MNNIITSESLQNKFNQALDSFKKNNFGEALNKFVIIHSYKKNEPKILNLISLCHYNLKKFAKAEEYISKAIALDPNEVGYYINKANIFKEQKKFLQTEKIYLETLKEFKNSPDLYYNLGVLYSDQHKYDLATEYYKKSLSLNNKNKFTLNNMGTALKELGNFKKCKEYFQRAILIDPLFPNAKFNLSLMLLLEGKFVEGWEKYESRSSINNLRKTNLDKLKIKKWDGSSLKNKNLVIYTEQGIGDSIHFFRYIKLIKKLNTKIILYTNKSLSYIFSEVKEVDEIKFEIDDSFFANYYISLMSLPYIFRYINTKPKVYNFLPRNYKDDIFWKKKINKNNILKAGLFWQGNHKDNSSDWRRSMNLNNFNPILGLDKIVFYSLQKDFGKEQIKSSTYEHKIINYYNSIDSVPFKDTIAIIKHLDIIISVDSVIAHVAATLGKKTFLLLPFVHDFRWGLNDTNTFWYENIQIFRQTKINDWEHVMIEIKKRLELLINEKFV